MPTSDLSRLVPTAPPALCELLDGDRGPVAPPIRSEIFGAQRFAQHGRSLGPTHRAAMSLSRSTTFFPRLRDNIRVLREAHRYIGTQARSGYDISPAAEWLLDNFHLIEAQLKEVHEGLPRRYFRQLPVLLDEPLAGLPRVYGLAWAFVAHTDGAFDESLLLQFLQAYQESRDLDLAEVWALPTVLRVVLIEALRRLAERVATNKAAREVANLCSDQVETASVATLAAVRAQLERRGAGRMFMTQLGHRLLGVRDAGDGPVADDIQAWLRQAMPDRGAAQLQQIADQAADNLSVSNAVHSLRAIGDADWTDIVARSSALMRLMLTSPLFESEHPRTRDQTLHGIERWARRSGRGELAVAQALLDHLHAGSGAAGVASHWLQGAGRPDFAQALGLGRKATIAWPVRPARLLLAAYLGALLSGTLGLVAWMLLPTGADREAAPIVLKALAAVLLLFPASEVMVAVINRLIGESVQPRPLPRLALRDGIPAEHPVMVVIPGMLTAAGTAGTLAHRLHLHYLANPEGQAQFALLTDGPDADQAVVDSDAEWLAEAVHEVRALNLAHPRTGAAPHFIVLHRRRRFSTSEQRWIGWERKRGKLQQLLALLATGAPGDFMDLGEASRIAPGTRYVVTLDSDTQLPPGTLHDLVGVAAHPANQPVLDATGRHVASGYAILQPRVVMPLPAPHEMTPFHRLFAGQCGIDTYSAASSEVYQDLFAAGSFSGKGLLHVQAMHAVLDNVLPDDLVLSHDLIEGAIAHSAVVTDIQLIESAPFHADVALWRLHRWMRGDWQLLPILLQPRRWPLRLIDRWKLTDNLRRSLVAPMSLALLLLALTSAVVTPAAALLLVWAAFTAGPLLGSVAGFAPSRDDIAKRHFYRQAAADLVRALSGGAWHLAQLLQQALMAVDAIVRALYRMTVSRRRLLQWTTAAALQAAATGDGWSVLRRHWSLPLVALLIGAGLLLAGVPDAGLALALCALWAGSPAWTWWASRAPRREATLPIVDRAYLEGIARSTWHFFERSVGADDHHLPPDNLQTLPHEMLAHRTSPTNIGLYLLAAACARSLGWIDSAQLLARLEATLATLDTMERHRGHFLNWYDTQSLAPLLPRYVSTVDSGNLSGHLIAVAGACRELARVAPAYDTTARLLAAARRCEQIAWSADFGFLYHRKRRLLHIGWRVAEQELDSGFYDLLASESRLTSLLAIAKGDVPVGHWAALGRPFFTLGTRAGLRSWSGSMFEYLMPSLVLDEPPGSVLHDACRVALGEQIAFARLHAVPWGLSESAYAGRDHTLAYQYAPQGVPRLALRRTPPDELVVAPYATALAAQIEPHAACINFAALQALGARSDFGFIEALDFTPARMTDSSACTPVATSMSHHQGMTIVALANVLQDGVARRWGMANPSIEAVASLLHERAPREVSLLYAPPSGPPPQASQRRAPGMLREVLPGDAALQPTHVLGNGRYSVTLRANGAGTSQCGRAGIGRSRDDALRDAHGHFFWLRWDRQVQPVSITQHPAPDPAAQYRSVFHADRVCFDAAWPEVQAHTTVWVSPEDDIEFRRVELRNLGPRTLDIELMSSFEVSMADPRGDEAHPAFGNLFVRAAWRSAQQALVFERLPRLASERGLHAAHFLAVGDPQVIGVRMQTDRARWLGRNRQPGRPMASVDPAPPSDASRNDAGDATLQTGLDPMCALAVRLRISPHSKAELVFATAATDNGGVLSAVIDKYRLSGNVLRASLMSATHSGIRLREMGISAETFAAVQSLTSALLHSLTRPVAPPFPGAATRMGCDRRLLWRFGISGDRPILLVATGLAQGLGLLRALAQALRLWAWGGVACDLVVVNEEAASYQMALQHEVAALREQHAINQPEAPDRTPCTGLHLIRADELSADELATLVALARVTLAADGRPLAHHVAEWCGLHEQAFAARHDTSTAVVGAVASAAAATAAPEVSVGRFAPDGATFDFEVGAARRPGRPWINVLANATFGALQSEAGGGHTWARNSRLNQLTTWSNDPVADPPGEWFLLQDRRTRQAWSVAPSAWGSDGPYQVTHGQGLSVARHRRGEAEITAGWCVDTEHDVKQVRLQVTNRGMRTLHWRAVGLVEWMLGAQRSDRGTVDTALHRQRLPERKLTALLATQRESAGGFGGGTAFLASVGPDDTNEDWTCDRRECFDARGCLVLPDHFGQRGGSGLDPCAALSVALTVTPGETVEQVFLLGYADSPDAARRLAVEAAALGTDARQARVQEHWDRLLGATEVRTPDPLFDALVNRWLLYQAVACRLWAKAGFYQAGGATGFRDQLQDALAMAWAAPTMLRDQILLAASRQFEPGDVQHWWHSPGGAGVRTHFSDDLLWLPHACVHYLQATGDTTLLDQDVPFLEGATVPPGAEDRYDTPTTSARQASVFEHGARAIDHSLRVGAHGLPLMGGGDWNDGMNRVGIGGQGESVWLGWFLWRLVADFVPLARERGEHLRVQRWELAAKGWRRALLSAAWDGQWFKRAYFDDGTPLGSHLNAEARIDLIAQAWSVLSGAAPLSQQRLAMAAVEQHLVDHDAGLVRLLTPPLVHATPSAGYIQAYPPGVRENGGQYSHAGIWALMAQAALARQNPGDLAEVDRVFRTFTHLSPAHRTQHPTQGPVYGIEPYVMAGDVCSQPPHAGRGGWSWYTGAAAWMHRAAIESIFGLQLRHDALSFQPCLPSHWPRAELLLRRDGRELRFILVRANAAAALAATAALRAVLLRPGEALDWRPPSCPACHVVPLL
ncbi:MAG: GH36-type glycosyl hydrolase domain-containing protein [Aquabacterium sp.]